MSQEKQKVFRSFSDLESQFPSGKASASPKPAPVSKNRDKKSSGFDAEKRKVRTNRKPSRNNPTAHTSSKARPRKKIIRFDHDAFHALKTEGREKYRAKDWKNAVAVFDRTVEMVLEYVRQTRNAGVNRKQTGDLDGAMREYREAKKALRKLIPVFYLRGDSRLRNKDYSGAWEDFSIVLKYQPDHKAARMNRVKINERLGNFDEVIGDLGRMIDLEPDNLSFYYKRGDLRMLRGDREGALDDYRNALGRDPESPRRRFTLGASCLQKAKIPQAIREFDRAIEDMERMLHYLAKSTPDSGIREMLASLEGLDFPLCEAYFQRAEARMKSGFFEEAEKDFTRVIELEPDHATAVFHRARVRADLGKIDRAIADLDRVLEREPENVPALLCRGGLKAGGGDFEGAIRDYSRVLEIEPYNVPIFLKRGDLCFEKRRWKAAEQDYTRLIGFKPKDFELYYKRASVRFEQGRRESARRDIKKALMLDPDSPVRLYEKARNHQERGRLKKAIPLYIGAIRASRDLFEKWDKTRSPEHSAKKAARREQTLAEKLGIPLFECYHRAGIVRMALGDFEQAVSDLSRAALLVPDRIDLHRLRGRARMELNDLKGALKDLNRCLDLSPRDDEAYLYRACAHARKGSVDAALKDFKKAIKLNPSRGEYHTEMGCFLLREGLFEGALFSLRKGLERNKSDARAMNAVALILAVAPDPQFHDPIESLHYAQGACEIDPSIDHRKTLAMAYSKNGDFSNAVACQEKVLASRPNSEEEMRLLEAYRNEIPCGNGIPK
jgi:tetratricopeptide (TPR) repeat protein